MNFGNALLKYIGYSIDDLSDLPFLNKGTQTSAKTQTSVRAMALVKVLDILNSELQRRLRREDLSPI